MRTTSIYGQSPSAPVVLVLDADVPGRAAIAAALRAVGLQVAVSDPLWRSDPLLARIRPDLVLLDPGADIDLADAVAEVVAVTRAPVIVVTARSAAADVAVTLGAGARDHIGKPWEEIELVARARRPLRDRDGLPQAFVVGELEVRPEERRVLVGGRDVRLTTVEFDLLRVLAERPGTVFHRSALLRLWRPRIAPVP